MSVRNISIAFMLFMIAAFIAIIALFLRLKNLNATIQSQLEAIEQKDDTIKISQQEKENLIEILESNNSQINKLSNFRTLAIDQCSSLGDKYPNIQDIPDTITQADLISQALWDDLNALSIGVSYESEAMLDKAKAELGDREYDFYYVKKVSNLQASFVIYYNNSIKEIAENMAEALKSVDPKFKAIKGKTPDSITNADQSKTIIVHING